MSGNGLAPIHFSSFFGPDDVICGLEGVNRDEVILELLKKLAFNKGIGNVKEVFNAVLQRERDFSTVITRGLSMPHARIDGIPTLYVALGLSKSGIAMPEGAEPVNLMILILSPRNNPSIYLQAVSSLMKILQNRNNMDTIISMSDPGDVWNHFHRLHLDLPDYVCAGDIMRPAPLVLKENDTLEQAISLFVSRDLIDVPVVDADGDLIGVVTAFELLKVCLPNYILWMDDLSPVLNFEPFAHILQNESKTWLAEIMSQEFASCEETSPAIQVAKEMTRRNARNCYVLRGQKLAGLITLPLFLSKVLRE